ncbi:hypothetical protein [Fodinicola acaciae]|uniref:hypothetical protein n=1 Tax=Fodinicola acaciae TaxID=2681555 RepID=UPI0013D4123D|nr:hypothetical protein [Fodinicola acaciae]
MVGILSVTVGMKVTALRRSYAGGRAVLAAAGATIGFALAGATMLTASSSDLMCLAFALWTVGWLVGPMITGGDTTLRPQHFSLLPLPTSRLAGGLLAAAFVNVPVAVTAVALSALVVHGFRLGLWHCLVAALAAALHLLIVVLAARLLGGGVAQIERTALGREVSAAVLGLAVSLAILGPLALSVLGPRLLQPWPAPVSHAIRWLPSSWPVVAVDARNPLPALAGMLLLAGGLFLAWTALLGRSTSATTAMLHHVGIPARSSFGAMVAKELRTYARDRLRGRLARMALWTSVFLCLLATVAGFRPAAAFAGLLAVAFLAMLAGNWYGAEGTSLWLTIMTPGRESVEVRGRQAAWALVAAGTGVAFSIGGGLIAGTTWTVPLVLAGLPALLGGGAGLIAVFSALAPIVRPDPYGRTTAAADSPVGAQIVQAQILLYLTVAAAAPAIGLSVAGIALHSTGMAGAGIAVGLTTGALCAWLGGRIATAVLENRAPDMLQRIRHGTATRPVVRAHKPTRRRSIPHLLAGAFLAVCQGLIPLVSLLAGTATRDRFWYVALYLPPPARLPAALVFLLAGAAVCAMALRRKENHQ